MPSSPRDPLPPALEDQVLQALELDAAARDAALQAIVQGAPQHALAIAAWLGAAGVALPMSTVVANRGNATGGGDGPTVADELADPPRQIGPYRVERLLGRGGFGSVWLCRRHGTAAEVAVKVLHPGMDSRDVLRRFAAEREALLRMDHGGIARCLDAGETAAGRPFFVMEYVPGESLLVHCRKRQLALPQRLHLFLQVLDAVAHAHQKGVIHRDLSANNVLVTGTGATAQPKIIDFGVAKSIREPLLEGGSLTFQGTLMGTPEFMSPEQAEGRTGAIDTRTDVYSLGVQLYELLTDQLPIPAVVLRAQGIAGMAAVIRTHVPSRPSLVAPRALQGPLRGDLDAIVQKAIAKERDDRYPSALEFALDLRRHLAHEAVFAAPPGTWYLVRKFARRNWPQVALAGALLLLLLGTLSFSLRQWQLAGAARADLQRVHDELTTKAREGFRLLASQQRLRTAKALVADLDPPWPDKIPWLQKWLSDYGEPMAVQLPELLRRRDALAARRAAAPSRELFDPIDGDLLQALEHMTADLAAFCARDGTIASVRQRLLWAEQVAQPALVRDASAWADIAATLRRERGFQLSPQPGLVPLGVDPDSRQFEFLDLASHPIGVAPPLRDNGGRLHLPADCGLVFVLVPAGTLRLGALRGEPGLQQNDPMAADDELRGHPVNLTDFFIARTELSRPQWRRLYGDADDREPALPVVAVDWDTAVATLRRHGLSLPTEAQWEYACRAGTTTPWWCGESTASVRDAGNFDGVLQTPGHRAPNAFGLFDVHGNVAEWCADWKVDYAITLPRSGDGLLQLLPPVRLPELRSVRGGSAADSPLQARSSARLGLPPRLRDAFVGLRPVRAVRP